MGKVIKMPDIAPVIIPKQVESTGDFVSVKKTMEVWKTQKNLSRIDMTSGNLIPNELP